MLITIICTHAYVKLLFTYSFPNRTPPHNEDCRLASGIGKDGLALKVNRSHIQIYPGAVNHLGFYGDPAVEIDAVEIPGQNFAAAGHADFGLGLAAQILQPCGKRIFDRGDLNSASPAR